MANESSIVKKVIAAVESGAYRVEYIAPECVKEMKHADGCPYYIVGQGDPGGVKVHVCNVTYETSYGCCGLIVWAGPEGDNQDLMRKLNGCVIHAWGSLVEPSVIMAVYRRARGLKGLVEWYAEHTYELNGLEQFLDDDEVRYKLISIWLKTMKISMPCIDADIDLNAFSVIHWLSSRHYQGDRRATTLLLQMMREGIEVPVIQFICDESDYCPDMHGNPYPPELYAAADYPMVKNGVITTKSFRESERAKVPKGF